MSLLAGYESSDDETAGPSIVASSSRTAVAAAPDIDDDEDDEQLEKQAQTDAFGLSTNGAAKAEALDTTVAVAAAPDVLKEDPNAISNAIIARPTDQVINVNLRYEDMTRPEQGPQDPFNQAKNKGMNSLSGE